MSSQLGGQASAEQQQQQQQFSDGSLSSAIDGIAAATASLHEASPRRASHVSTLYSNAGASKLNGEGAALPPRSSAQVQLDRRSSASPSPASRTPQHLLNGGAAAAPRSPASANFVDGPASAGGYAASPAHGGSSAASLRSYTPTGASAPSSASLFGNFPRSTGGTAAPGSNSDHSRHSSGYASSLGLGGAGGAGGVSASTTVQSGAQQHASLSSLGGTTQGLDGSISGGSATGSSAIGSRAYTPQGQHFAAGEDAIDAAKALMGGARPPFTRLSLSEGTAGASQLLDAAAAGLLGGGKVADGPLADATGNASDPRTQLFISNLPYRVRWQDVKDLFRKAGTVLRADVSLTPDNRSRGHGSVLLATEEDAHRAVDMFRGFSWQGRILEVRIDRSNSLLTPTSEQPSSATLDQQQQQSPTMINAALPTNANLNLRASMSAASPAAPSPGSGVLPPPSAINAAVAAAAVAAASPGGLQSAQQHLMQLAQQSQRLPPPHLQPQQQQQGYYAQPDLSYGAAPQTAGVNAALYPFLGAGLGGAAATSGWGDLPHSAPAAGGYAVQRSGSYSGSSGINPQSANYHSPQHLLHTANAPPPNVHGGVGRPSAYLGPPLPPGSNTLPPPNSYYGRVLFVGNLPFHCQWQDLKDLFRAAGNIQRADVALSPEGRSRGFGTVLFANAEDAQNAVRIYHGYEYSGRTLKVHFDRFAQMTAPPNGSLPATPSQYTGAFSAANPPSAPVAPSNQTNPASMLAAQAQRNPALSQRPMQARPPQQQQQQQYGYLPQQQQRGAYQQPQQALYAQQQQLQQQQQRGSYNPYATPAYAAQGQQSYGRPDAAYGTFSSFGGLAGGAQATGAGAGTAAAARANQGVARPGHIALPPSGFSAAGMGPLSPAGPGGVSGMSIPMTPGMPGFTFHAIPQTPPVYPHHFLSPGLGPFSPPLGSPHMGGPATPGAGSSAFNPLINPAPGAPVHLSAGVGLGFNPLFPPVGGAAYPQQQQQAGGLPATPHWNAPAWQGQSNADATAQSSTDEAAAAAAAQDPSPTERVDGEATSGSAGSKDATAAYPFPLVQPHLTSTLLQRRASTNSPAGTPGPGAPGSKGAFELPGAAAGWERRGSLNAPRSDAAEAEADASSLNGASTEELTRAIARMSVKGTAMNKGSASGVKSSSSERPRHPLSEQLVAAATEAPSGSALDDGSSSAGTPDEATALAAAAAAAARRVSEVPTPSAAKQREGLFAAQGQFKHLLDNGERRRSFAGAPGSGRA